MSIILSAKFLEEKNHMQPYPSYIPKDFEKIQPKATKRQEINTKSCMCRTIFPNKTE